MAGWQTALDTLVEELKTSFGERLSGVVLYGSRARGDADEGSDIDTMVLLSPCEDFWADFRQIRPIVHRVSLDNDVVVSALPIDSSDYARRVTPLLMNVRREGLRVA